MKTIQVIPLCILLVLLSVSCGSEKEENSSDTASLAEYLSAADLPENLSIRFDPDAVEQITTAKLYQADFLEFDEPAVKEAFLKYGVTEEHSYAEGPQWETEAGNEKEYLSILDGGASYFGQEKSNSGVSYSHYINGQPPLYSIGMIVTIAPDPIDQNQIMADDKHDFASFADLAFEPYAKARDAVTEQLTKAGFPDMEIVETYSLDLGTMQRHQTQYLKDYSDQFPETADEVRKLTYTEEDEAYLFLYRQMVDGIPLANTPWLAFGIDTFVTYTSVSVLYTKDGIRDIQSHMFFTPGAGAESELIGGAEACQRLIDTYAQSILETDTRVESMELNYVAVATDRGYELIPAWLFRVAILTEYQGETYDRYTFFVLNACTGEQIVKAG